MKEAFVSLNTSELTSQSRIRPYPHSGAEHPEGEVVVSAGGGAEEIWSVSRLSTDIRKHVEGTFRHVRVRGEISGYKCHTSGHHYFTLKDAEAAIDAVCWRSSSSRLSARFEEGLEVICTGRVTTYAARSKYQMIVEEMKLSGEGALLKLLEERKRKLAAEGLFAPERKKPLPFFPRKIGIITSPTGAVLRDILHRLHDRMPSHVYLWPVAVQGNDAVADIVRALEGVACLAEGRASVAPPDVIIIARGGGSLEDLWVFNDEAIVRAVAACPIPTISAIGHETDTTLIDFAADVRAPTPTAAAEFAVPTRRDLLLRLQTLRDQLYTTSDRVLSFRFLKWQGISGRLFSPLSLITRLTQRLDDRSEGMMHRMMRKITAAQHRLTLLEARLGDALRLDRVEHRLAVLHARLGRGPEKKVSLYINHVQNLHARLGRGPEKKVSLYMGHVENAKERLASLISRVLENKLRSLENTRRLLETLSYHRILQRGFSLSYDENHTLLTSAAHVSAGSLIRTHFSDGSVESVVTTSSPTARSHS